MRRPKENSDQVQYPTLRCILPKNALRRDCNDKYIELIEGHFLEVVVEVYIDLYVNHT